MMNRIKHFTLWLCKRTASMIAYAPRRINARFVEMLEEIWFLSLLMYLVIGMGIILVVMIIMAVTEVTKAVGIPIVYGILTLYVAYFISAIIQIQYRIYCDELIRTQHAIKHGRADADNFDF